MLRLRLEVFFADIPWKTQILLYFGYIEIIQTVEMKQIITDTLWIYETLAHFFIRCQTKRPKNVDL
jgi:hypothetical protein